MAPCRQGHTPSSVAAGICLGSCLLQTPETSSTEPVAVFHFNYLSSILIVRAVEGAAPDFRLPMFSRRSISPGLLHGATPLLSMSHLAKMWHQASIETWKRCSSRTMTLRQARRRRPSLWPCPSLRLAASPAPGGRCSRRPQTPRRATNGRGPLWAPNRPRRPLPSSQCWPRSCLGQCRPCRTAPPPRRACARSA